MAKLNANGAILWEGRSQIDGAPIMLIATGLKMGSRNEKTGNLVQTWILRSDMTPKEAVNTGADESICGTCPHRGEIENGVNVRRSCYVTIWQAPRNIYETAKRGVYPRVKGIHARTILARRSVRLGAYGDPAAIPFHVWDSLLRYASSGTGYTHQWTKCDSRFSRYCMASADDATEAEQARVLGYRTFRVGTMAERIVQGVEFLCPASVEAGKKINCAACLACGGTSSKNRASVFIPLHGAGAGHAERRAT